MSSSEIIVDGKPVAKQRPRLSRSGQVYTPAQTKAFERHVRACALRVIDRPEIGPVHVDITSVFGIPKSWSKSRRVAAAGQPHTSRPDLDNLTKSVLDGLNGVAFIDDSQVHSVTHRKVWSTGCGAGQTIIRLIGQAENAERVGELAA